MSPIELIFFNSLQSAFLLAPRSEYAWFSTLEFGAYNMLYPTLAAFAGAVLSMGVNFYLGYYIARTRENWVHFNEDIYNIIAVYFRRYAVWLLLFPALPLIGLFASLAGIFRVKPWIAIGIIALGRIGYYGYYLIIH